MIVTIAYGSIEGQTAKIADFIKGVATKNGFEATLIDTGREIDELFFEGLDKFILAASVHERRHPKPFETFIKTHRDALLAGSSLMLSVSLKAAFAKGREEAEDYLAEMILRTGFEPDESALVAGAVRPESYDYYEKEVVRHVVLRGRRVDLRDGIQEFTDWAALEAVVTAFLNR